MSELLYQISKKSCTNDEIKNMLSKHKNIRFVSLMGVDLGGNSIDEKIPIELFLEDIDAFLQSAIQTDGSSVELHNIATLNDAKVDLMPDSNSKWYIDYNFDHIDDEVNKPVGTLKIPAFLIHGNKKVCSRGVLQKADRYFKKTFIDICAKYPHILKNIGINSTEEIEEILLTSATELEFWVNTAEDEADLEKLSISQSLKEQYWKRTHGVIRTCLEKSLIVLQRLGIEPEMAHKEVGGINSSISKDGKTNHAMEQLEISWKFSTPLQAADNELLVREVVEDIFKSHGLEVTFKAKPIHGVAGSGGHTHVGVSARLKNGKIQNLFTPVDMREDYLSEIGYGSLMGILKNYEVINPIITNTNDGFNRLVPGFEAPVCIVTSLGHTYEIPSRNRSVLVGLVRDIMSPKSVRMELRSPNPLSNTYLVIAACYQAMLDGIKAVAESKMTTKELEKDLSKGQGDESFYLETDRVYRDENDVFEHYTLEERNSKFGMPPATVYENMKNLEKYSDKLEVLKQGNIFNENIIESFKAGSLDRWSKDLKHRIIEDDMEMIRGFVKLHAAHNMDALDEVVWNSIEEVKYYIMKNTMTSTSLFTKIKEALADENYELASNLQLELKDKVEQLQQQYIKYRKNIF